MLQLPAFVMDCLNRLEGHGFEGWCVGGCVRDLLLGRTPSDFDLTTNALPEEIDRIFPHVFESGRFFGTITVITPEGNVEITTYRTEGGYADHRRPDQISFSTRLEDDLSRRDFTINAMAYSPERGLVDCYGGQKDLNQKVIRTVGNASDRFEEDALRIFRCFRFACQLNFEIEQNTFQSALGKKKLLARISKERLTQELVKSIAAPYPSHLFPLFGLPDSQASFFDETADNLPLRLALLCRLLGCVAERFFKAFRFSKKMEQKIYQYYQGFTLPVPCSSVELKRSFSQVSPACWLELLPERQRMFEENTEEAQSIIQRAVNQKEPWRISDLAVTGGEVMARGYTGAQVGEKLNELLELVWSHPEYNQKSTLLSLL